MPWQGAGGTGLNTVAGYLWMGSAGIGVIREAATLPMAQWTKPHFHYICQHAFSENSMKKTTLTVVAVITAVSLAALQVSLVTVGHSGGGSTTLVLRSQGPAQGAGVAVGQVAPPDFDKFNFFESDSHFCAKVVPRDACEAAVASAVAERALLKLPYIGAVKSLSLLSD